MAKEQKLTPWFPASVRPVRAGVYNVSCRADNQTGDWYSYWNGSSFRWYSLRPSNAARTRDVAGAGPETKSWRGLAEQPK